MDCPSCGESTVAFAVPPELRKYAPDEASAAAICPRCLTVRPAPGSEGVPSPDGADFSRIIEAFPAGRSGVGMALAVGLLVDSLTLNRAAVGELLERVGTEGADPWLVLERLEVAPSVEPDADLGRARRQLEQLLRE